jgi:hypothetical protein
VGPDPRPAAAVADPGDEGFDGLPDPGVPDRWVAGEADTRSAGTAGTDPLPDSNPPPDTGSLSDTDESPDADPPPTLAPGPDTAPPPDGASPPADTAPPLDTDLPPDSAVLPLGSGWWAAADRAVQEAGAAVHAARLALGHASRSVRTAHQATAADEAAWRAGPAGRSDAAPDALGALAAAADAQRARLADLLQATTGGGLADRPRIAVTDAVTGALLTLTDLPGLRRTGTCGRPACRRRPQTCSHDLTGRPGLGRPEPTDGYAPGAALDRFVRARDRRCRFPGCRRRVPRAGELDHHRPHADGGQTAAANLAGYCTSDHDPVGELTGASGGAGGGRIGGRSSSPRPRPQGACHVDAAQAMAGGAGPDRSNREEGVPPGSAADPHP